MARRKMPLDAHLRDEWPFLDDDQREKMLRLTRKRAVAVANWWRDRPALSILDAVQAGVLVGIQVCAESVTRKEANDGE